MQATRPVDQANLLNFSIQFLVHLIKVALLIAFTDLAIVYYTSFMS